MQAVEYIEMIPTVEPLEEEPLEPDTDCPVCLISHNNPSKYRVTSW